MSSSVIVHTKKHKCRSCKGKRVNFSSPVFGRGDFAEIVVDFAPCHCSVRGAK